MTCPECGEDVPAAICASHAEFHWPEGTLAKRESEGDPREFAEARKRKSALLAGAQDVTPRPFGGY